VNRVYIFTCGDFLVAPGTVPFSCIYSMTFGMCEVPFYMTRGFVEVGAEKYTMALYHKVFPNQYVSAKELRNQ